MSRNPFLQTFEAEFNKEAQLIDMSASLKESPKKATFGKEAEDLFVRPLSCTHRDGARSRSDVIALHNPHPHLKSVPTTTARLRL